MPSKVPFEATFTVQKHLPYSIVATDGVIYRPNDPLTLLHFQDGITYSVKGSVSAKGNKYISEIVSGPPQPVAAPVQQPGLPPLPPAPVAPQVSVPPLPVASVPLPPSAPIPVPAKKSPPPFKKENVEGKVACALGAGVTQYLASVSQTEVDFMAKYKIIMPQLIAYHQEKGWL